MDNETNTKKSFDPISIPFCQGWLEKKSKYLAAWRPRWVYLHGLDLYTFKEPQPVYSYHGSEPEKNRYFNHNVKHKATEIIDFSLETNPIIIIGTIARPYSFQLIIHPETNYQRIISFVASSQSEYQEWVNKLQQAIDIINDNKLMITKISEIQKVCIVIVSCNVMI